MTKESTPLIIVNPRSASGATRENWSMIADDLRAHFGEFQTAFTKSPGDGINIAYNACQNGRNFIIACGGDGTINEVANGILRAGTDSELGIFPSGTGGDLRRSIGLPTEPREAAKALRSGITKRIDVGKAIFINNEGGTDERFFLNIASLGLAVAIIERVKSSDTLEWLPFDTVRGRAGFALSFIREIAKLETVKTLVSIDGEPENEIETVHFCLANAKYFGGGMMIAPNAKLDDGCFDVVSVSDINTVKAFLNAYTIYTGKHIQLPEVTSRPAKTVSAKPVGDEIIRIELDGELVGRLPAKYQTIPNALRVRFPNKPAP